MTPRSRPLNSSPDDFLSALRTATGPMHERLEQSPLSTALLKESVSTNDYAAYLQKMEAVVWFADHTVLPLVQPLLPDAAERKKHHWIQDDLAQLGASSATTTQAFAPFHPSALPYALGFFYVIEGSTLGGRVLLKHLQPRLGITAESGGRFFNGYGGDASAKWKAFIQTLSQYATENRCEADVIQGAQHAFETIHRHFDS